MYELYSSAGKETSQPIFDVRVVLICRKWDVSTYIRCKDCTHLQEKGHLNLFSMYRLYSSAGKGTSEPYLG